jgi:hypothetical protein
MTARPENFTLHISDHAITDLRERLGRTRFPDQAPGTTWRLRRRRVLCQRILQHQPTLFRGGSPR